MAAALFLSTAGVLSLPCTAVADDTAEDLRQLRAAIQKELADLKKREEKLHQQFLRLDQKSQLLDEQLRKLRAAGIGPGGANPSAAAGGVAPAAGAEGGPKPPAASEVAQTSAPATATQPAPEAVPRLPPRRLRRANQPPFPARRQRSSKPGKSWKPRPRSRPSAAS